MKSLFRISAESFDLLRCRVPPVPRIWGPGDNSYDGLVARNKLRWQSKTVLLLVFPAIGADIVLETRWWLTHTPSIAI